MKPTTPSAISALRPRLSDWRAQCGAVSTQSSADQLNAKLTHTSGICNFAPIAGRIDCIAVLPAAATSITANSTAMRSEGMECDVVAMFAPPCLWSVTPPLPTRGRLAVQSQDRLFPCAPAPILPRLWQPQQRESQHDQSAGAGPRKESSAGPSGPRGPQAFFRAVGHVCPRLHQASGHGGRSCRRRRR